MKTHGTRYINHLIVVKLELPIKEKNINIIGDSSLISVTKSH